MKKIWTMLFTLIVSFSFCISVNANEYSKSLGHYLTVDSVIADGLDSSNITRIGYIDPFYENYGRGDVYGRHTDSFENIFRSVLERYLIW